MNDFRLFGCKKLEPLHVIRIMPVMNMFIRPVVAASIGFGSLCGTALAQDKVDFEKDLLPILEAKCFECHKAPYVDERGRTKKPKSGFRMDAAKFFAAGGDIQADNDPDYLDADLVKSLNNSLKALVPGKADESTVYRFSTLDEAHDMVMPPKGDPLTDAEKAVLKRWIDEGADFGEWKGNEEE